MLRELDRFDPVDRDHPLNRGRFAWWLAPTGMNVGRMFVDLMGRYHATPRGNPAPWVANGNAQGVVLDGSTNDFIANCPAPALTQFTVGVRYVPLSGFTSASRHLFQRCAAANTWNSQRQCGVSWLTAGQLRTDSQSGYVVYGYHTPTEGVEYQYVIAVDETNISVSDAYVNGVKITASRTAGARNSVDAYPFLIGSGNALNRGPELISEVFLYDRLLSAAEIAQLYDQQKRGYPDVLRRSSGLVYSFGSPAFNPWWVSPSAVVGSGVA